jgi:DNA primase
LVAFVSNSLKQEVYLQEVSSKFNISQQSLFNELGVQNQVVQSQPNNKPSANVAPKLELVDNTAIPTVEPLLVLEEKLVEMMLKYGDRVLNRKDANDQPYETSVIEEVLSHFSEDNYVLQSPLNKKIIQEIEQGIKENALRTGDFFITLMDEELNAKAANVLIDNYQTSDWEKHNIYFQKEDEVVPKIISDVIYRHKREFIIKIIEDLKTQLLETENSDEIYMKILTLNQLKNKLDEKLFRIL